MSTRGRISLGVGALVLIAALVVGLVAYRDHSRTEAAKSFQRDSRPEYKRIQDAMERLAGSVRPEVLGVGDGLRKTTKAKSLESKARALREETDFNRQLMDNPRAQVNAVKDVLRTADRSKLSDVEKPALGGDSEQLKAARRIGKDNERLIARIDRFLPKYSAVISSIDAQIRTNVDFNVALARGVARVQRQTTPGGYTGALGALLRSLRGRVRAIRDVKPAPDLRSDQRRNARTAVAIQRDLKEILAAAKRLDVPAIERTAKRIDRRERAGRRRARSIYRRLLTSSRFSRELTDLLRQQERIDARYSRLRKDLRAG